MKERQQQAVDVEAGWSQRTMAWGRGKTWGDEGAERFALRNRGWSRPGGWEWNNFIGAVLSADYRVTLFVRRVHIFLKIPRHHPVYPDPAMLEFPSMRSLFSFLAAALFTCSGLAAPFASAADDAVDFATQIKPLLSDRCFLCHGPDAENRQADLRLDSPEGLIAPLESNAQHSAVVAGDSDKSELITRIMTDDEDLQMPPVDSGLSLTKEEKSLLKRWIDQGAEWQGHWAFQPIVSPRLPDVKNRDWCQNEIDHFIVAKQEAADFGQTSRASKERLLRRATFELTGLPPTLGQLDAFLADDSGDAFLKVIDQLLESEHFGERMTSQWLDVARYSDTYGYQVDRDRFVWPWRDWVVKAFNDNMPHDRFITEQLAGDLLPEATQDQILATTFNRLHPQKVEGGSVPEEFRVEYVADRAQTVATAFLGLTLECARCHDHKYDPISQREYYQLYSFFNNIDEAGLYSYFTQSVPTPTLSLPSEDQRTKLVEATQKVTLAENALQDYRKHLLSDAGRQNLQQLLKKSTDGQAESNALVIAGQVAHLAFDEGDFGANKLTESERGKAIELTGDHAVDVKVGNFPRWQPFTVSTWLRAPGAFERSVVFHRSRAWTDAASRGYELLIEDGRLSAALIHFWPGNAIRVRSQAVLDVNEWHHVAMTYDGSSRASGLKIWLNGVSVPVDVVRDQLTSHITGGGGDTINIGQRFRDAGFAKGLVDDFRVFDRELTMPEIRHLFDSTVLPTNQITQKAAGNEEASIELVNYVAANHDETFRGLLSKLMKEREALFKIQDAQAEIMVMKELPVPRQAHVLTRGAYDAPAEEVFADIPASLPAMHDSQPRNRLGLARWLTSSDNPLTARVAVNRFWQMCFGHGLVRSPEDFGSQGMAPTHPLLLDWLAADFQQHNWDVKRLMKQILTSATWQQDSTVSAEQRNRDPENLLLSHAPVFRLTAEMLRDNSLAVSGLLHRKIGGKPVHPYELAASFKPSKLDTGTGLYRRSLYTYWKRTAPAPMMMTLDASKRDVCRVKRERTASPLQALVVMNGPQFVEAARMLADRLIVEHAADNSRVLTDMFRWLTSRQPTITETETIQRLFEAQYTHFQQHAESASEYLSVGEAKPVTEDAARLAAWASVANTLFAFDECMMKR